MNPDRVMADNPRRAIEGDDDRVADLRLWRSVADISARRCGSSVRL